MRSSIESESVIRTALVFMFIGIVGGAALALAVLGVVR